MFRPCRPGSPTSSLLQGCHLLCLSSPQQQAPQPLSKRFPWLDRPTSPPLLPRWASRPSRRLDRHWSSPLSQVSVAIFLKKKEEKERERHSRHIYLGVLCRHIFVLPWFIVEKMLKIKDGTCAPLCFYLSRSATTSGPFAVSLTLHLRPSSREPDSHCRLPSLAERHPGNRGGLHDGGAPRTRGALVLRPPERPPSRLVQAHGRAARAPAAPIGASERETRGQAGRAAGGQTA